jgi:peptidyl-prolyl cis-trans isomerase D
MRVADPAEYFPAFILESGIRNPVPICYTCGFHNTEERRFLPMLDLMRRKKRLKFILWVVIFSLALGMLLFFVPGVNMGSVATDTNAATVDGQPIPMKDFASTYRRTVERYSNGGKNKTDPETLKALGLSRQVLDELITSKVVEILAERFGIQATPDEVRQAVETHPYLQDQGKFIGVERYKALLAANNYTVTDFEEDIYKSVLANKLREIITDSLDVSDRELRDEFSKTNQKTQVDYVILKNEDFKKRVNPAEAELRSYFDAHKEMYRIKEKRRAQYLLVPVSQILPSVTVTEQEILNEWNQSPHEETVEASHILFRVANASKDAEVKAKAEAVLRRAKAGEDFAALAKKHSEDTKSAAQGGYLGPFQRGQMIKEFEDAAFSLKPGEISDLVRTPYGYHIIKVSRHEIPTLESNRARLTAAIQLKKAQDIAKQKAEEAARLAAKQKDLSLAGRNLGVAVEIKETSLFTKEENALAIGIPEALRDEIFELKEINSIGKAVEHPSGYAVPKLIEVQMPKPGDFAESRAQVLKDCIDSKATELMQAEAKKLSEEAAKQGSLEKAAKGMGLSATTSQEFNITGTPSPEIGTNSPFNKAAFELEPGSVSTPQPLLNNTVVFQVKSRTPFDESAFLKKKAELRKKLLSSIQDPYFQDFISKVTEDLEKAGKIRINPKALEQAPQSYY